MTPAERRRRLEALEQKLNVTRAPRLYTRDAATGEWFGDGPPGGELGPRDRVIEIACINPDGRLATPEELAGESEACRPGRAP